MADKVMGGTPKGSESLCVTCRLAHVMIGLNLQSIITCRASHPTIRVAFPVMQCSVYDDKRMPSLYDMEQIAWEVKARNRGRTGFQDGTQNLEVKITPPSENRNGSPTPPIALAAHNGDSK